MSDLRTITKSLRSAVDDGDLGKIAEGIVALERFVPETGSQDPCRCLELSPRFGDDKSRGHYRILRIEGQAENEDGTPAPGTLSEACLEEIMEAFTHQYGADEYTHLFIAIADDETPFADLYGNSPEWRAMLP